MFVRGGVHSAGCAKFSSCSGTILCANSNPARQIDDRSDWPLEIRTWRLVMDKWRVPLGQSGI